MSFNWKQAANFPHMCLCPGNRPEVKVYKDNKRKSRNTYLLSFGVFLHDDQVYKKNPKWQVSMHMHSDNTTLIEQWHTLSTTQLSEMSPSYKKTCYEIWIT